MAKKTVMRLLMVLTLVADMVLTGVSGVAYAYEKVNPVIALNPISSSSGLQLDVKAYAVGVHDGKFDVKVEFYLVNHGKDTEITFNTSQKFDYWIVGENFSYHYADGKMFLQVITPLKIKAGETVKLGEDTVSVPFGTYELKAQVAGRKIFASGILNLEKSIMAKIGATAVPVFTSYDDIFSSIQIVADVENYVVSDSATVKITFYVKNSGKNTVVLSNLPLKLDILGGHASSMAYTSEYDDGKYLQFAYTGTLKLKPGEEKEIAVFQWDQSANVRTGRANTGVMPTGATAVPTYVGVMPISAEIGYYPWYVVVVKNGQYTIYVGQKEISVPTGRQHMAFPLFRDTELKEINVPTWVKDYIADLQGFLLPTSTKGIDFEDKALRAQVLWGAFRAASLKPVSTAEPVFTDIRPYYYMEGILAALKEKGIVKGYPDGSVRLGNSVSRAEATAIMIRLLENIGGAKFDLMKRACRVWKDMTGDEWYAKYACYGEWVGIISGYPDGTFRGLDSVKVSELAKMLSITYKAFSK